MTTTLYRAYNQADELLYVGISGDFLVRTKQHSVSSKWHKLAAKITLTHFETRSDAEQAEVEAIRSEKPLFNKKDNEDWHNSSTHLTNILGYSDSHHTSLVSAHTRVLDSLQAFSHDADKLAVYCYAFQSALQAIYDTDTEDLDIPCVSCEKLYYSDFMEEKSIEFAVADAMGARSGKWGHNDIWETTVKAVRNER